MNRPAPKTVRRRFFVARATPKLKRGHRGLKEAVPTNEYAALANLGGRKPRRCGAVGPRVTILASLGCPLGQKIEAVEGIVPVRHSLVGRCAATGLMQQRIADLLYWLLRITLAKTGAA
jgi:hypothetical protein